MPSALPRPPPHRPPSSLTAPPSTSSRSLSPRNSRTRSSRESPRDGRTPWATWGYIETYPASNISRFATRGYRSMSPPPITTRTFDDGAGRASWGGSGKRGTLSSSIRQVRLTAVYHRAEGCYMNFSCRQTCRSGSKFNSNTRSSTSRLQRRGRDDEALS